MNISINDRVNRRSYELTRAKIATSLITGFYNPYKKFMQVEKEVQNDPNLSS